MRITCVPALDGLRAIAALLVVLIHVTGTYASKWRERTVPGGFIGVDIFFVLSGFLITMLPFRSTPARTVFGSATATCVARCDFCRFFRVHRRARRRQARRLCVDRSVAGIPVRAHTSRRFLFLGGSRSSRSPRSRISVPTGPLRRRSASARPARCPRIRRWSWNDRTCAGRTGSPERSDPRRPPVRTRPRPHPVRVPSS